MKKISKKFEDLQSGLGTYKNKYNKVMYYLFNHDIANFGKNDNNLPILDTTAIESANVLINDLNSMINPQSVEFLDFILDKKVQDKIVEKNFDGDIDRFLQSNLYSKIKRHIAYVQKRFFYVLNNKSNYYKYNPKFLTDFIIGTACSLIIKDENNDINFINLKPDEYAFDVDINDKPNYFLRKKEVSCKNLKEKYNIEKILNKKDEDTIECYEEAKKKGDVWEYKFYVINGEKENEVKEAYREFKYCPFVLNRYTTFEKEKYGYGLFCKALPAVYALNRASYNQNLTLEFLAKPMIGVSNKLNRSIKFRPGSSISINNKDDIVPITTNGDPNSAQAIVTNYQNQVKSLLLARSVFDLNHDRVTATQVSAVQNEKRKVLLTPFNSLRIEMKVGFKRILELIHYEDDFFDFEDGDIKITWKDIDFEFNSEISQTQDRIESQNILNTVAGHSQIFGVQETMKTYNFNKVQKYTARQNGVPEFLFNTKEEQDKVEQMLQQQAQAQNGNNQ